MVKILEDKIEMNVITLENGIDYLIIDTIINSENKYIFLAQENNDLEMCIRKVIKKEDNEEYLVKLDNDDEFEEVMTLFNEKHTKKEGFDEK